jgi:hypothetical protein
LPFSGSQFLLWSLHLHFLLLREQTSHPGEETLSFFLILGLTATSKRAGLASALDRFAVD